MMQDKDEMSLPQKITSWLVLFGICVAIICMALAGAASEASRKSSEATRKASEETEAYMRDARLKMKTASTTKRGCL